MEPLSEADAPEPEVPAKRSRRELRGLGVPATGALLGVAVAQVLGWGLVGKAVLAGPAAVAVWGLALVARMGWAVVVEFADAGDRTQTFDVVTRRSVLALATSASVLGTALALHRGGHDDPVTWVTALAAAAAVGRLLPALLAAPVWWMRQVASFVNHS